ncbi:hypothetical protein, conserved [Eimeria tenella]|uniref:Transmembrane protein n=1 Tax=Eimeria tenella TaxID=5802 RepID=U6KLJ0_EIMTE|nr:hypothetical protein, conserved [Eimeria tenella]CDJ37152.1 hypothetical protein, conserved [Eimeria tenella]|eukprot:XP_013227990.1 hypothetical protein, conserved [Eimeria tenella]
MVFAVEDMVAFTDQEAGDKEVEDRPIHKHEFGSEAEGASEAEAGSSEKEEGEGAEETKKKKPAEPEKKPAESASESVAEAEAEAASASESEGATKEAPGAAAGEAHLNELASEETETEMKHVLKETKREQGSSRDLGRDAINQRLAALGAPFVLGKEHFTVEFNHGLRLPASEFDESAAERLGVLARAVSAEPNIKSEKSLFLSIDIDDPSLGTDVRLVQLKVKPDACSVQAEAACNTEWLLRDPTPAALPHRIVLLGFSSPTGSQFEFDDVLKQIQNKPMDLDLRRISLARFFSDHAKFFNDANGKFAATPSWNDFALVNHKPGEGNEMHMDRPLLELPPNASEAQKAEALRISRETNEEIDGLSTPEHGGESPGAAGRVSASTIFKYVLASLLLIGLFIGIAVSVCPCGKQSS